MNSYGNLPVTGATLTLGGVMFDQAWLLIAGVAIVVTGVSAIRLSWRRNLPVSVK